jgi:hypothetical protein
MEYKLLYQKWLLYIFWKALGLKTAFVFRDCLVLVFKFWYILWTFHYFLEAILVYFFNFGILYQEKSGSPATFFSQRRKSIWEKERKKKNETHLKAGFLSQFCFQKVAMSCPENPFFFFVIIRVARWFVFKTKIQIWVNFRGPCNGRCWYIVCTLGPFYGLLLYFMDIWYSSWKFGIFSRFGILCEEKSGNPGHHFVTLLCRLIKAFVTK